jgi:hypothetical protein
MHDGCQKYFSHVVEAFALHTSAIEVCSGFDAFVLGE